MTTVTFVPGVHAVEGRLRKASWSLALEARSKVTSTAPCSVTTHTSNGCSVAVLLAWRAFNAASTTARSNATRRSLTGLNAITSIGTTVVGDQVRIEVVHR